MFKMKSTMDGNWQILKPKSEKFWEKNENFENMNFQKKTQNLKKNSKFEKTQKLKKTQNLKKLKILKKWNFLKIEKFEFFFWNFDFFWKYWNFEKTEKFLQPSDKQFWRKYWNTFVNFFQKFSINFGRKL